VVREVGRKGGRTEEARVSDRARPPRRRRRPVRYAILTVIGGCYKMHTVLYTRLVVSFRY
jgi:hypothetical protein